jgi:uncharacterized protein (DUF2336 family)
MPRTARDTDDALKAVALTRSFFAAPKPDRDTIDIRLWKLLKNGSAILRAEMAEQLAPVAGAPRLTLRALACDPDPEVALPILRQSSAICDRALAEVALCKGARHLAAIAARPGLDRTVTAILVRRGGKTVLETLAENRSASFSKATRRRLERRLNCARPQTRQAPSEIGDRHVP